MTIMQMLMAAAEGGEVIPPFDLVGFWVEAGSGDLEYPPGLQANDLLIVMQGVTGSDATPMTSSGWQVVAQEARKQVSAKVADGTETGELPLSERSAGGQALLQLRGATYMGSNVEGDVFEVRYKEDQLSDMPSTSKWVYCLWGGEGNGFDTWNGTLLAMDENGYGMAGLFTTGLTTATSFDFDINTYNLVSSNPVAIALRQRVSGEEPF